MAVYLLFVFFLLILWKMNISRKQGIVFLGIYLILILSLRSIDVGYNDTRYVYYDAFNRFQHTYSIVDAIQDQHFRREPLMAVYIYITAKILRNFQLFLAITATISLIPIIVLLKKEKNAYISILYFFSFYYFFYFYLIKQILAIVFVVSAFRYIKEKKCLSFIFYCLCATLVHKFAWPCLIAYPLCHTIKFKKRTYIIVASIISFGIFFSEIMLYLIIKFDPTHLMVSYINIYEKDTTFNFGLILNIIILIFCALMRNRIRDNLEEYNLLLVLSSINCIFNSYSLIITEFQRLAFFFGIYNSVLLPRAIEVFPAKKQTKKLFLAIVVFFLIVYGLGRTAINTKCIPYKWFWNG